MVSDNRSSDCIAIAFEYGTQLEITSLKKILLASFLIFGLSVSAKAENWYVGLNRDPCTPLEVAGQYASDQMSNPYKEPIRTPDDWAKFMKTGTIDGKDATIYIQTVGEGHIVVVTAIFSGQRVDVVMYNRRDVCLAKNGEHRS